MSPRKKTSRKKPVRRRTSRRRSKRDSGPSSRIFLVMVLLLFAFGAAGLKFVGSDRGAFFLLDRGWADRYDRAQEILDGAIVTALSGLHVPPESIERSSAPLHTGRLVRTVRNIRAAMPAGTTLARVNLALTSAVRSAGGSVVLCREFRRSGKAGAIELWAGSRKHPTHRVRVYEAGAPRSFDRAGLAFPEGRGEEGEPPFPLEPEGALRASAGKPEAPAADDRPKLALVVDDFGYSVGRRQRAFLELDRNLTISVLPDLPKTRKVVRLAHKMGHEVILHLPMEPEGYPGVDTGVPPVTTAMRDDEIQTLVRTYLDEIEGWVGANNHMGSKATADPRVMRAVLEVFSERDLFFLDSSTTPHSVAGSVRSGLEVAGAANDLFLDGNGESEPEILDRFSRLLEIARARGTAVGICHPRQATLRVLRRELPRLEEEGITLVPLSTVVD